MTRYGAPGRRGGAPAVVSKPGEPARTFAWKLKETIDRFANAIRYGYGVYGGEDGHHWQQPLLSGVGYVGYGDPAARLPDVGGLSLGGSARRVSDHRAGLEIRTTPWWVRIRVATCASDGIVRPLCEYRLGYAEMHHTLPRRRYLADSCSAALTAAATSRFLTCSLAST